MIETCLWVVVSVLFVVSLVLGKLAQCSNEDWKHAIAEKERWFEAYRKESKRACDLQNRCSSLSERLDAIYQAGFAGDDDE